VRAEDRDRRAGRPQVSHGIENADG
jgi:hypothetical protein